MLCLPAQAALLEQFAGAFTAPSFQRFVLLSVGAIVCFGRRSVSRILWAVRALLSGHPSSYHRVFSRRRWSLWPLGKTLAQLVLAWVPPEEPLVVDLDDTVDGPHRGRQVYAHASWRDAVRSSWGHTTIKWGHKWVVLAVNVRFPSCRRPWALPILVALARKPALDQQEKRRHKTPAELGRQLLAVLIHWFPRRRLLALDDWGFGSHDLALFCHRHRRHVTLIARCRSDLNLWSLPRRPRRSRGGWQKKAGKLPTPSQAVQATAQRCTRVLPWYGESQRAVEMLSGCGGWYRPRGHGRAAVVPVRWVFLRERPHGGEAYLYCTDPALTPERIASLFPGRWPVEVTFAEVRALLGLESTRHWCRQSVLRVGPCLLGLFTVVSLIYARIVGHGKAAVRQMPCYAKGEPTFSDALFAVRKLLWSEVILQHPAYRRHVTPLPPAFRNVLLEYLAEAG